MSEKPHKNPVETSDTKASILAAFARAEEVTCAETLIDFIPEKEWIDPSVENWKIEVGSSNHDQDELDAADEHLLNNAAA